MSASLSLCARHAAPNPPHHLSPETPPRPQATIPPLRGTLLRLASRSQTLNPRLLTAGWLSGPLSTWGTWEHLPQRVGPATSQRSVATLPCFYRARSTAQPRCASRGREQTGAHSSRSSALRSVATQHKYLTDSLRHIAAAHHRQLTGDSIFELLRPASSHSYWPHRAQSRPPRVHK